MEPSPEPAARPQGSGVGTAAGSRTSSFEQAPQGGTSSAADLHKTHDGQHSVVHIKAGQPNGLLAIRMTGGVDWGKCGSTRRKSRAFGASQCWKRQLGFISQR